MAKAKRARRTSIRTMEPDGSALAALEALERAEASAEAPSESRDEDAQATATAEPDTE